MRSPIPRIVGILLGNSCLNTRFLGDIPQGKRPVLVNPLTGIPVITPRRRSMGAEIRASHDVPGSRRNGNGASIRMPTRIAPERSNDREIAMFSNCLP